MSAPLLHLAFWREHRKTHDSRLGSWAVGVHAAHMSDVTRRELKLMSQNRQSGLHALSSVSDQKETSRVFCGRPGRLYRDIPLGLISRKHVVMCNVARAVLGTDTDSLIPRRASTVVPLGRILTTNTFSKLW